VRQKNAGKQLTEDELTAEGDKSPGVLMASGYIAGGAIAGILIAFMAGVPFMQSLNEKLDAVAAGNPLFIGPHADLLSCIPFAILMLLLYLTGRERILRPRESR
jgi:hypothetical protein